MDLITSQSRNFGCAKSYPAQKQFLPRHAAGARALCDLSFRRPCEAHREKFQDLVTGGDCRLTRFIDQVLCHHTVRKGHAAGKERRHIRIGGTVGKLACYDLSPSADA